MAKLQQQQKTNKKKHPLVLQILERTPLPSNCFIAL
jgi:ureidoglycolate hydrolase